METLHHYLTELEEIVSELESYSDTSKLTLKDKFDIALRVQENRIKDEYNTLYARANVIEGQRTPSALEKIAMELESISQEGIISQIRK